MVEHLFQCVCHQLPDRSPCINADVFPLCYRCAGIHLGLFVMMSNLIISRGWQRKFPTPSVAILLALMLLPIWIDGWANGLGLWNTPDFLRYLTGLSVGLSLPLLVVPLCRPPTKAPVSLTISSLRYSMDLVGSFFIGLVFLLLLTQPYGVVLWDSMAYLAGLGTLSLAALAALVFCTAWKTWKNDPLEHD